MNNGDNDCLDFFILRAKKTAEEQRVSVKAIQENKYLPKTIDIDQICNSSLEYAKDCERIANWLEELRDYRRKEE